MLSTNDLDNMITLMRVQIFNLLSISNRLFVTETKLSVIIHAPSINLVGIVEVEWVVSSTKDVLGILGASFLYFERLLLLVSRLQLTSNFAWFRITPSIDFLTFGQCNCMLSSAHNFLDPLFRQGVEMLRRNSCGHLNFAGWLACDHILYRNKEHMVKNHSFYKNKLS